MKKNKCYHCVAHDVCSAASPITIVSDDSDHAQESQEDEQKIRSHFCGSGLLSGAA